MDDGDKTRDNADASPPVSNTSLCKLTGRKEASNLFLSRSALKTLWSAMPMSEDCRSPFRDRVARAGFKLDTVHQQRPAHTSETDPLSRQKAQATNAKCAMLGPLSARCRSFARKVPQTCGALWRSARTHASTKTTSSALVRRSLQNYSHHAVLCHRPQR